MLALKELIKMDPQPSFCNYFSLINLIGSILTGGIIGLITAFITHKFTTRRDLQKEKSYRSLELFKLNSNLLKEINLFLKSQKGFCENYNEYQKREYNNEPFHPIENSDNLLNLKNKTLSDFFDNNWLDIFYEFNTLIELSFPKFLNKIERIKILVEDIYPLREMSNLNDEYLKFYEHIIKIKDELYALNKEIKLSLP